MGGQRGRNACTLTPPRRPHTRPVSSARDPDQEACAAAAEVCACFNFRRTARAVTRFYDDALAKSGLRSTQFVMLVTMQASGSIELPELARQVGLERSVLTRRLDPLVRKGFVTKKPSKRGGASVARLTTRGRRKLTQCIPLWESAQSRFESQVGKRRWRTMLSDLDAARTATEGD